jgi:UDP-N-acetylmuramyl pentapeptide phosphotransferase/UDP-N-acetylglucosamine-1-phosphate transferase
MESFTIFLNLIILLLTTTFLKIYIIISRKFKLIDIPDNLSIHKSTIPTGAGIIFFLVFLIFCQFLISTQIIKIDIPKNYYIFLASLTILTLISFYDDLKDIHPVIRLFFQITIIFFCTSLFNFENINLPLKLIVFLVIYFWVYIINIINFTDGIDGFLSINSLNFFLCILLFYHFETQQNFVYLICLICIPILIGYLIFNKPPAKLFMGDSGSIFIGFLIGYISINVIIINRLDIIISLLSYTFMDCTLTIIKKIFKGQSPWARLFDYYFLIPVKNNQSHKKVFNANLIYNLAIFCIVLLQIIFDLKLLCVLSFFLSLILIYYFSSFSKKFIK